MFSKTKLEKIFAQNKSIKPHLPETALFNLTNLEKFLSIYKSVYIKPVRSGMGIGVIKAWQEKGGYAFVKEKGKPRFTFSIQSLYERLKEKMEQEHIIQMAIPLAEVDGRPFDIRLMVMRNQLGKWSYIGMLAKVAGENSIITNIARGKGYVLDIDSALKRSLNLNSSEIKEMKKKIVELGFECSRTYDIYRYDWQIGYDIGIDKEGKIWLIEANPRFPSHVLFAKLPDKRIYYRIKKYARLNKGKR